MGYRTISIAGTRDPVFIKQVDDIIGGVRERVADNFRSLAGRYRLLFRLYGRDGVMGQLDPLRGAPCHELGIIIEAVAETQEQATAPLLNVLVPWD